MNIQEKYILDTKTKNRSFMNMFRYLKNKGNSNPDFMLRLYDKDLLGVDPNNPRLSEEKKNKVLAEIIKNPFYYLRNVVLINVPGRKAMFDLHPGNLAIVWAVFNSLDIIALLPRQKYKTVSIAGALSWIYNFGTKNTHMLFGNKSLTDSKNNLKRFKDIVDNYPVYLKKAVQDAKDVANIERIESRLNNNKIEVSGQPGNETDADKQG